MRDQQLKQKKLKPTAIPRAFHHLLKYLSTAFVAERGSSSTSSARHEKVNAKIEKENASFLGKNKVKGFDTLKCTLSEFTLPSGYVI